MSLFDRLVKPIISDRVLSAYGAALALVNALAGVHWLGSPGLADVLAPSTPPVCWPILPGCYHLRVLPVGVLRTIVVVLIVVSVWNAKAFWQRERIRLALGVLAATSLVKYWLMFQDFRLTLNHHYMAGWVLATFMFAGDKRRSIQWLLVCMYFWAGVLKVDPGAKWLTAAAFYGARPLSMPASWLPAACAYVVVLELLIAPLLLSRRPWLFWPAFVQIVVFHVASFWVVGWFYPLLMFCLLALFVFDRLEDRVAGWPRTSQTHSTGSYRGSVVVVCLFSAIQLSRFAFPGDSSITGEGRMFTLNMFDAPVECRGAMIMRDDPGKERVVEVRPSFVNTRTRCDPLIYVEVAHNICRYSGKELSDFDLLLESRKDGDDRFEPVVDIRSFCRAAIGYSLWHHNAWIITDHSPRGKER